MHLIPTDGFTTKHLRGTECECRPAIVLTEEADGQLGWAYQHNRLDTLRKKTN